MDGQIILTWGDPAGVAKTEGTVDQGFAFQGYNLYELPGPSFTNQVKIGTFDLVDGVKVITDTVRNANTGLDEIQILQFGTDAGVARSYSSRTSRVTNGPLINGTKYFFAVTAYSHNANPPAAAGTHSLESPAVVLTVVPQTPNPGTRYPRVAGDTLKTTKTGSSDGTAFGIVIDPTRLTGNAYKVSFKDDGHGTTVWDLTNTSTGKVAAANQYNQTGDDDYPIIDGSMVKVVGPPPGMKSWDIPSGTRRFSPVGGFIGLGLEGFSTGGDPNAPQDAHAGTIGMAGNFAFGGIATNLTTTQYHNVLLKLAAVKYTTLWDPKATPTDANFSRAYRYLRSVPTGGTAADPSFAPGSSTADRATSTRITTMVCRSQRGIWKRLPRPVCQSACSKITWLVG